MMKKGRVKWFSGERGYGFIESEGKDYFAHFKEIRKDGYKTLEIGQQVQFNPGNSAKGAIALDINIM